MELDQLIELRKTLIIQISIYEAELAELRAKKDLIDKHIKEKDL